VRSAEPFWVVARAQEGRKRGGSTDTARRLSLDLLQGSEPALPEALSVTTSSVRREVSFGLSRLTRVFGVAPHKCFKSGKLPAGR
jgi:hypothetical protein